MSVNEEDVENDIEKTTVKKSKAVISTLLHDSDSQQEQKLLNETLPTYERHVCKWKNEGLDRILNTFDEHKIEREVGAWLRCNNSTYSGNTMMRSGKKLVEPDDGCDSEAESMHSMDTARYIRASRQNSRTSKSTKLSTIKMYRTVPRKRDELRAKYGCAEYDEELQHHHRMQELRHRRHQKLDRRELPARHYSYNVSPSISSNQQRRKLLRKRRANSPLFRMSSSEDECERDMASCVQRYANTDRCRSASSFHMRHKRQCNADPRPHRLEQDCCCHNAKTLCADALHYVNTSSDKWLVENCAISECINKVKNNEQSETEKPNTTEMSIKCSPNNNNNIEQQDRCKRKDLKCAIEISKQTQAEAKSAELSSEQCFQNAFNSTALADHTANERTLEAATSKTVNAHNSSISISDKGILLYAPSKTSGNSSLGSGFTLTEESLGKVIGQRMACKYLKYHVGNHSFDSRCSVYYRPPQLSANRAVYSSDYIDSCSASNSDEDIFERLERCGTVYAVIEKSGKQLS